MSKILLTLVTSMVAMFIMIGASFADGHCNKFADIKGKAWVDGDCMETPLGEKWWATPYLGEQMIKQDQLIGIKSQK